MPSRERQTDSTFKSSLPEPALRFLSQALVHALDQGWCTADDFLRHFGPDDLMEALSAAPELRAELLSKTAGVNAKIARKKSTASAIEDLRLALSEGITSPAAVVSLLPPDERVRLLDPARVWSFLAETRFWTATPEASAEAHARACQRMTFLIENALGETLITLKDLADGISFREIAARLPQPILQKLVQHALECSRLDVALSEEVLLEVVPLPELLEFIPLPLVYDQVIQAKVAAPAGFVTGQLAARAPGAAEPTRGAAPARGKGRRGPAAPEPAPAAGNNSAPPPYRVEAASLPTIDDGDAAAAEQEARRQVTSKLRELDRLPPSHEQLSLPMLLSIEAMYADLIEATDDATREEIIRDAFPNGSQLRAALIALIELLDPTINTEEPLIRDAEVEALTKIVLFEERRRASAGAPSTPPRSGTKPPPLPEARRS